MRTKESRENVDRLSKTALADFEVMKAKLDNAIFYRNYCTTDNSSDMRGLIGITIREMNIRVRNEAHVVSAK